jgi:acrylyl-CoA reductase (NADPH)
MKTYPALVATNPSENTDDFASIRCSWQERSIPELADNEVQIAVSYSSLNYKDALAVTGKGKILRQLPLVPGIDATGIIFKSRSREFKEGDPVLVTGCGIGEHRDGGLGQILTVPASWVIALPSSLTLETAALLGTAGFTAGLALHQLEKNDLSPTQNLPVLVTGGTGGVGSLSLLMLKKRGYKTFTWTRKKHLTEQLKKWGADEVQSPPSSRSRPLESAQWAAAIDNVGGDVLAHLLSQIKPHGSVATIGLALSSELHTTVFPFILRGVNLLGISSGTCPRPLREKVWQQISQTSADWSSVKMAEIGRLQVFDYCERMIRGETLGRCLVHMQKEVV